MIKQLSIQQYKGFYQKEIVTFAYPDGEKAGSGLTIIAGPNNTGKTTIVESLLLNSEKNFKKSERHGKSQPKIIIRSESEHDCIFTNNNGGSKIEITGMHQINFDLIPSRRYWNHRFRGEWDFPTFREQSVKSSLRNATNLDFGPLLNKILKDTHLKSSFDQYMKRLVAHFTDWTIDTDDQDNDYIEYKTGSKDSHQAYLLGDGIISLFRIVAHLISSLESVLIIDEPELSLHPATQKVLAQIISEVSKNKQIILCTHSPYFLRFEDVQNGAVLVRTNKLEDKKCTVSNIKKETLEQIEGVALKNKRKPYSLGIVAKEIFFTDNLVFVEGQEDVGILKHFAYDNNITMNFDFFGYGADGAENIIKFLELSKQLQIKVGAIYDSDKTKDAKQAQRAYPEYSDGILTISTDDIRDKYFKCPNCKERVKMKQGLFDENGTIKGDKEKKEIEKLFSDLNDYF